LQTSALPLGYAARRWLFGYGKRAL
jgi:hypothetical protein